MKRLLVLLLLGALVLAACGGSDDDNDALAGNNTSDNSSANNNNSNGDSGDSDNSDYQQLLERAKNAKIRVTYKLTTSENSEDQVLTLSSNGEGKQAYFYDDGDTHVIADGENYTVCSNVNSDPSCTSVNGAAGAGALLGFTTLLGLPSIAAQGSGGPLTDTSTETIAGREATCVSINYLAGEWKSCADKETGIGLLWQGSTGNRAGGFEATEVGEPQDSDFEPDAEPTEVTMPNITLPGGGTIPGIGG